MPNHTMTCFKLPKSLCKRIQSALTRFWWDANPEKRGMCWVSWTRLAKSKKNGGLGFRDIETFNEALLAKQSWRILTKPGCLLARVLLGKYARGNSFLTCTTPSSASHGWRGVMVGRDLLKRRLGKAIGNGETTLIWSEPWISLSESITPLGPPTRESANYFVSDLFNPFTKTWDKERVQELFPELTDQILKIQTSKLGAEDRFIWLAEKKGTYSTKTGYHIAMEETQGTEQNLGTTQGINWNTAIWNRKTSPKLQLFLWKALQRALPVGENLMTRSMLHAANCLRCGELETTDHLLLHCSFAKLVWSQIPLSITIDSTLIPTVYDGLHTSNRWICLPPTDIKSVSVFLWVCWAIWNARNKLLFENREISVRETITKALKETLEWQCVQEQSGTKVKPTKSKHKARPPETEQNDNTIICHSDGAWKTDHLMAGVGFVFSVSSRRSIKEGSLVCPNVSSPLMAEALAMLEAILCAKRQGWKRLKFLSDSQTLIKAITSEAGSTELYGILHDIHAASLSFEFASFSYVSRLNNATADHLAKAALSSVSDNLAFG